MNDDTRDNEPQRRPDGSTPEGTPPPPGAGATGWSSPGPAGAAAPWNRRHDTTTASTEPRDPREPGGIDDAAPTATTPDASGSGAGTGAPATAATAFAPPPAEQKPRRTGRGRLVLAGLAIGAILGGGAGAGVTALLEDDETAAPSRSSLETSDDADDSAGDSTTGQPTAATSDVQQVAEQVLPSVVSIAVQGQFGEAGGTGVVISSDGEILTNNHVVGPAGEGGTVQVTFADNTTAEAEVLGTDPLTDLAVIKAQDVSDLTPADLGSSSDVAVGEQVVAIGSPLGLDGTVTTGIISALNRPVMAGEQQQGGANSVIDAIQTDAPINPGNSGGPLVNMDGQVVGINSAIATAGGNSGSIGLGFAIPIDQAKPIVEELIAGQEATHAQIGVGVGNPQDGTRGALIASVNPGSAGEEGGLQEGDIVTAVDDRVISDATSLIAAVRSYRPGDEITLSYLRDGEEQTTTITLDSDAQTT